MSANKNLSMLRVEIDAIDQQLIDLLNERAKLTEAVAQVKSKGNIPVRDKNREQSLLDGIDLKNNGPLSTEFFKKIYTELFTEYRAHQYSTYKSEITKNVSVVGMGLMGGSLYKAIKKHHPNCNIKAYDVRTDLKIEMSSMEDVLNSDFIFLAMPVDAIVEFLKTNGKNIKAGSTVIDLGSTKSEILEIATKNLKSEVCFVGGHPLVGKELSGFENSSDSLFYEKVFVLTPIEGKQIDKQLIQFIKDLNTHTVIISAQKHDQILALTSHLPHLVSIAMVLTLEPHLKYNSIDKLVPRSFMDVTRVAGADPGVWDSIFKSNWVEIKESIHSFMSNLKTIEENLLDITAILNKSKDIRNTLIEKRES